MGMQGDGGQRGRRADDEKGHPEEVVGTTMGAVGAGSAFSRAPRPGSGSSNGARNSMRPVSPRRIGQVGIREAFGTRGGWR